MPDDDDHQCTHLIGRDHAKRRCENTRTVGKSVV